MQPARLESEEVVVAQEVQTGSFRKGISKAVLWAGRAISEAHKSQRPMEAGGLLAGAVICFPLSKTVALVLIIINVGTYGVNIIANTCEDHLPQSASEVFQRLRYRIKEIKDKVPIVLMAAVAVGFTVISWPLGLLVTSVIIVIRGGASNTEDPAKGTQDVSEMDSVSHYESI